MITIDFTYQTVTPESAEHGDFAEHGFITPGYWKYPLDDSGDCKYERTIWGIGDLRGLIDFAHELGIQFHGFADWAESVDPDRDYSDGSETFYAMHINGCSDFTRNRIYRLLEG